MNMPQATSTSLHDPSTPAVVQLVDTAGRGGVDLASLPMQPGHPGRPSGRP
jgi:hypothetical protein